MSRVVALVLLSALALSAHPLMVSAKAKIIHVPSVLSNEARPNPPGNEDDAAGWHGRTASLPKILRLQASTPPIAAALALSDLLWSPGCQATSRPAAAAILEPGLFYTPDAGRFDGGPAEVTANTFYGRFDQTYAGHIYFQKPQWDTDRFLPATGWSEAPQLWSSHIH